MTDASGNVVERLTYDSFGDSIGSNRTRYDYTGRERDKTTNLIYYRARWYDPQTGRFLSEDPIGFAGGMNFYTYVENNPLSLIDPFGLDGTFKLPSDPSGLPSSWKHDPTHKYGKRLRHPNGDVLDFHPKNPKKSPKTHGGKDHWHHNGGDKHLYPGAEVPNPDSTCEPEEEKPKPVPFIPIPQSNPQPRPVPWYRRLPLPALRFPVLPIIINPCVVDPDFPGCGSRTVAQVIPSIIGRDANDSNVEAIKGGSAFGSTSIGNKQDALITLSRELNFDTQQFSSEGS